MTHEEALVRLQEAFPECGVERLEGIDFTVLLPAESIHAACLLLRDELGFDYLSNLTAVDRPEGFEVVYHLYSLISQTWPLALKVQLPDKEDARLASVTDIWEGANYQEREVYDLFGIRFDGHPNLKRILLWEGFPGHPLRKDFANRLYTQAEMLATMPPEEER